MGPLGWFYELTQDFSIRPWQKAMSDADHIPVLTVGCYWVLTAVVPGWLKEFPLPKWVPIRGIALAWNLLLSVFSTLGMVVLAPFLLERVSSHGLYSSVCAETSWYDHGAPGLMLHLFILSKIPELTDTALLILQQKPVIFLHSYHHVTVLVFCWSAYVRDASAGIWYAAMNYSVHSVMYAYYAAMAFPSLRKIASKFAVFITSVQILQMVVGSAVTFFTAYARWSGLPCQMAPSTQVMGCVMYMSYLFLFVSLFRSKYQRKHFSKCSEILDKRVPDASGFFHGEPGAPKTSPMSDKVKQKGA